MKTYDEMVTGATPLLGDIPREWTKTRVFSFARERKELAQDESHQLLSISEYFGVAPRNERFIDSEGGSREGSTLGYRIVRKNDLAMNYMLSWKGAQAVSDYEGVVSPAYAVFSLDANRVEPRFIHYLFRSKLYQTYFKSLSRGIMESRLRMYPETFLHLSINIPGKRQQQKIADFLDAETGKIDILITKQERLLELLEEKRRATITHAVTRGLNSNVELKETNIPLIGKIPSHWGFEKNKYHLSVNKGLNITKADLTEKGIPVISYGQVHSKYPIHFDPAVDPLPSLPESYLQFDNALMKKGDFIFADTSENYDGSGNFSMLTSESLVLAGYHSIVARLTNANIVPEYQAYYFASDQHRNQIRSRVSGVKVFSISQSIIANAWSLIPPTPEQKNIVAFLDAHEQKTKDLKQRIHTQISRLRERRTSLISHAVTGKVKI